ncbi:MAG: hypothetical protein Q9227_000771 [Pyrenula ochraceoflavens]
MSSNQASLTELKKTLPQPIQDALEFERQQWATGSVFSDPFYSATGLDANAPAGSLLKVEKSCDSSKYMTPPATALSRFIYQSKTLNGSLVPVSAVILWPYSPRRSGDGFQVVAWSHGTSGTSAEAAPSHVKNLWQHYLAPFNLALQGYVVVQTDYAGLGVAKDATGKAIVHEYLACPSHANDVVYSVQAAQAAFPQLSKCFVVAGHSQGGGSAWACEEKHSAEPIDGYLGTVAISPVTDVREESEPIRSIVIAVMAKGIKHNYPEFQLGDILTDEAIQRLDLIEQLGCTSGSAIPLLMEPTLLKPGWKENIHLKRYFETVANGKRKIAGPMLVVHGAGDENLSIDLAKAALSETARISPAVKLEFVEIPGARHNPTLLAGQRVWVDWIADRFAGVQVESGYKQSKLDTAVPIEAYQSRQTWYLEQATQFYHTP